MKLAVIIPAAGSSSRYLASGGLRSKLDEDLGGKPVLQRTIEIFAKFDTSIASISSIIVAGPHDPDAFSDFRDRHGDRLGLLGARLCPGGAAARYESVQAALSQVGDCSHVAVHDAARPCLPHLLLDRLLDAASHFPAVVPVLEAMETIKRIEDTGETWGGDDAVSAILGLSEEAKKPVRRVTQTVDRTGLVMVQTPQIFEVNLLRRAYSQPDLTSTDDASLVEKLGERVITVEGDPRNIKITRAADIEIARAILGLKPPEGRATHKKF